MITQVAMSACAGSALASGNDLDALVGPAGGAAEDHRRRAGQVPAQAFEGAAKLPGPRLADRIVERDDEAGAGRRVEPPFDQVPGLQIVRQRDGAEIMPERRADPGRDGQHGGDAGHDGQVDRAPFGRSGLDRLADRRRHGEDAGIAAGDDRDLCALRRPFRARPWRAKVPRDCRRRSGLVGPQLSRSR